MTVGVGFTVIVIELDNVLHPEDRDTFYMLEDAGLMETEREETTLYDGREWRIHYWKFKSSAEAFALAAMDMRSKKKVDDDPYAGIYDDMPANLWKERSGEEDDWEEPLF